MGPWPQAFDPSRRWCFLKLKLDAEPVRILVDPFLLSCQFDAIDPRRPEPLSLWGRKFLDARFALHRPFGRDRSALRSPGYMIPNRDGVFACPPTDNECIFARVLSNDERARY